jgi:hypothetical protein
LTVSAMLWTGRLIDFIRIGSDLDRPVVTAKQHRILLDQPLGRSHTNAATLPVRGNDSSDDGRWA